MTERLQAAPAVKLSRVLIGSRRRLVVCVLSIATGALLVFNGGRWGALPGLLLIWWPISSSYFALADKGFICLKHWKPILLALLLCAFAYCLQYLMGKDHPIRNVLTMFGSLFFGLLGGLARSWFSSMRHKAIVSPPGNPADRVLRFWYSRKTMERVFHPVLADMQAEWSEAMFKREVLRARWVIIRGHLQLLEHAGLQSLVTLFASVWKAISKT